MKKIRACAVAAPLLLTLAAGGSAAITTISDFEDGSTGLYRAFDGATGLELSTDTPSPESTYSLKINVDTSNDMAPKAENYFGPVDLTQHTYVSFYVKVSDARFLAGMMQMWPSDWWAGLGGFWTDQSAFGADTWFRVEYAISAIGEWTAPWNKAACNGFLLEFHKPDEPVQGAIWIDHMVFSDLPGEGALAPAAGQVTIISDFEDGTTGGYTAIDGTDSVALDTDTPSPLSTYSLKLTIDPTVGPGDPPNPAANPKTELYFGPVDITQHKFVSFYIKATDPRYLGEVVGEDWFGMMQMWPSEWWAGLGGYWTMQGNHPANTWVRLEYPISAIAEWSAAGTWKPTECNGFLMEFRMPDPPVAGAIWIDHMVFSDAPGAGELVETPSSTPDFEQIAKAPEGVMLTWSSEAGSSYDVEKAAAPSGPWAPIAQGVAGAAETTSYTDAAAADPAAFYQVKSLPPPPLFFAGFEPGEDLTGWTEVLQEGDTHWERGTPTSGPGAAYEGANVYATNLAGDYYGPCEVGLRSPLIDLTGVSSASLSFYQYYDFLDPDYAMVNVLDASGTPLMDLPLVQINSGTQAQWIRRKVQLPAEALGKPVMFEFWFSAFPNGNAAGWYIDNVRID